jgi:hypothetical protein
MGIEKYIAAASLGLFAMFVGEIITLYTFLINPPDSFEFIQQIEPSPKILQFISIGVAPAVIMAGVSFIMSKKYGSKPVSAMIIAGGAILLVGMIYSYTLIDQIQPDYVVDSVKIVPPLFIVVSFAVIVFGVILLRVKKPKPKKEYL